MPLEPNHWTTGNATIISCVHVIPFNICTAEFGPFANASCTISLVSQHSSFITISAAVSHTLNKTVLVIPTFHLPEYTVSVKKQLAENRRWSAEVHFVPLTCCTEYVCLDFCLAYTAYVMGN
jgi:hypothetical protein